MRKNSTSTLFGISLLLGLLPFGALAATLIVNSTDGTNEGFNAAQSRTPVGGNSGTTLGEQRRIAFQAAADLVGSRINSDVAIVIDADFSPLDCETGAGVLGFAGPVTAEQNFPNAPLANIFYPQALANALAGADRTPSNAEIEATFNSSIDNNCLGSNTAWYYGLDGNPPGNQIDLLGTVAHELLHGVGFISGIDESTGNPIVPNPAIFDVFIKDLDQNSTWHQMSPTQRRNSATNTGRVVWNGPGSTTNAAPTLTAGTATDSNDSNKAKIRLYAPNPLETGSSISHWDETVTPEALMEAADNGYNLIASQLGIETCLLQDIGWTLASGIGCPDSPADGPQLVVTPENKNFGGVVIGETAQQQFVLTYAGDEALNISGLSLSGGDYSIDTDSNDCNGNTLAPASGQCSFTVAFAPSSAGFSPGTVTIRSNANNDPVTVALSATGQIEPAPLLNISPSSYDFGQVDVGAQAGQIFTLSNTGDLVLEFGSINIDGAGYSLSSNDCSSTSLEAGQYCTLTARLSPTSAGPSNGSISIPNNTENDPQTVNLSGTAVQDSDGIDATEEAQVPNGAGCAAGNGDGNCDGTADAEQSEVTSFRDHNGNYVTLVTNSGSLVNVQATGNPDTANSPSGVTFNHGFFRFDINCHGSCPAAVEVRLILDGSNPPQQYYKYGPRPSNAGNGFYAVPAGTPGASINGNTVTLTLVDGQTGDGDLLVNGVITDPGAPASVTAPAGGGGGGGGGGCTLTGSDKHFDPLLWFILLTAGTTILVRAKTRT